MQQNVWETLDIWLDVHRSVAAVSNNVAGLVGNCSVTLQRPQV